MNNLGHELFDHSSEGVEAKGKTPWEIINTILASVVALSTLLFAAWDKHPRISVLLLVLAFLLVVSAFGKNVVGWFQQIRARRRRNRFARTQFPELVEFAKRFGRFVDSGDGKNLRNILFSGCGNNHTEFDKFGMRDYMDDLWPHFFTRLQRNSRQDEAAFCNIARELCTLVSSYNRNYVLDPLKRIDDKLWLAAGKTNSQTLEFVQWFTSLPEHQRSSVKKQINDFLQRWLRYLDDFVLFLDRIKDSFKCPRMISDKPSFSDYGQISSYFERPAPLE